MRGEGKTKKRERKEREKKEKKEKRKRKVTIVWSLTTPSLSFKTTVPEHCLEERFKMKRRKKERKKEKRKKKGKEKEKMRKESKKKEKSKRKEKESLPHINLSRKTKRKTTSQHQNPQKIPPHPFFSFTTTKISSLFVEKIFLLRIRELILIENIYGILNAKLSTKSHILFPY